MTEVGWDFYRFGLTASLGLLLFSGEARRRDFGGSLATRGFTEWLGAPERPLEPHWKVMGEQAGRWFSAVSARPPQLAPARWQIEVCPSTAWVR